MKSLQEHIHHVRRQPHHVKKQVTFVVAGVGTGLVGVLWLAGNLWLGHFALPNTTFADANKAPGLIVTGTNGASDSSLVAGAANARDAGVTLTPAIQIIDTRAPVRVAPEPTVIPF